MKPRLVVDEIHRLSKAARPTAEERRAHYLLRNERFDDFLREFQGRMSDRLAEILQQHAAGSLPNEEHGG